MKKRRTGKDRLAKYAFGGDETDPTKPVYKTQAEVDAANQFAKRFAAERFLAGPQSTYVAKKPGDPVAQFLDSKTGKPYVETQKAAPRVSVPNWVTPADIQSKDGYYWYEDVNTGSLVDIDPGVVLNNPKFKAAFAKPQNALQGALAKATFATGGKAGSPNPNWMGIAQMIPGLSDTVINLLENNPRAYSKQPIVNSSTMRGMVSPYANFAFGGVEGMGEDEMMQLQAMADEQGISIEELIQMLQQGGQQNGSEEPIEDIESEEYEEDIEEGEEEYAYGGRARANIEVEGREVIKTPGGRLAKIKGPSHEKGGVDISVPKGTEIFSKRIKIDGKTMAQRKLARERTAARLAKLAEDKPLDKILKSTIERTMEVIGFEDNKDMEIQKVAGKIYAEPEEEFAYGGKAGNTYAYGGFSDPDPLLDQDYLKLGTGSGFFKNRNYKRFGAQFTDSPRLTNPITNADITNTGSPNISVPPKTINRVPGEVESTPRVNRAGKLTLGDYMGIAGNAFNAVAPLLNTEAARRNSKPNVNRFLGFGKDAIDVNEKAQDAASRLRTSTLTDIDTSANTSRARTRNNSSSINTTRAMDAITDLTTNRAKVAANDSFAKQMINLMGQRSQLENQQDAAVMRGETARDIEDKADKDNYYTNKAQNLTNLGTNVQGIGRALNQSKANRTDTRLLGQLSKYGLEFDDEGNLISVRS